MTEYALRQEAFKQAEIAALRDTGHFARRGEIAIWVPAFHL